MPISADRSVVSREVWVGFVGETNPCHPAVALNTARLNLCLRWSRLGNLGSVAVLSGIERIDRTCSAWVVARRRPGVNQLFVIGSHTGEKGVPWALLLMLLRVRARGGERLPIARGLAVTVGSWAAAHALKRLDHRRRPCQNGDARSLVACPKSSSLPSDEAACAFAAATFAASRLPRLAVPLFLGATFTAASRVYVGVHYPSDVAAGASLGALIASSSS